MNGLTRRLLKDNVFYSKSYGVGVLGSDNRLGVGSYNRLGVGSLEMLFDGSALE